MACGAGAPILHASGFAFTRDMAAVRSQSLLQDPLPERRDGRLHPTSCREPFFRTQQRGSERMQGIRVRGEYNLEDHREPLPGAQGSVARMKAGRPA